MKTLSFTMSRKLLPILLIVLMGSCKKTDPVVADFTADPLEALTGENIQFTNASEYASEYKWDFGGLGSSSKENPSYVFEDDGRHKVDLVAIGEENSDTASLEIDIYRPYEQSIFEGVGIEDVYIDDAWSLAETAFSSDTIYIRTYLESIEGYRHLVYYPDEGVVYFFINQDTIINQDDALIFIILWPPYEGGTTKRLGIGSTMKRVIDSYGEPEDISVGNGEKGYWYDSQGIDFYTYDSGYVEEIWIYTKAGKKLAIDKKLLRSQLKQHRIPR